MTNMVPFLPKMHRSGDHYCHLAVHSADKSATRTRHPTSPPTLATTTDPQITQPYTAIHQLIITSGKVN